MFDLSQFTPRDIPQTLLVQSLQMMVTGLAGDESDGSVPFPEYAADPIAFAYEILQVGILTGKQEEILLSLRDNQITNVQAGNSLGKTWLSGAVIVPWWVFAVGGLCVTTAPTEGQVKELLWSEVRKAYDRNRHVLGGQRGVMYLRLNEYARAYGFVARDYDSNAFQGKHAERLLLILDEACGISRQIDEAAESCVTGTENRMLRIGNPIADGNSFSEACAKSSIIINSWSHPNVSWAYEQGEDGIHRLKPSVAKDILTPEAFQDYLIGGGVGGYRTDKPVLPRSQWPEDYPREPIPGAVSIHWIERTRASKGENSTFWQSRVEARFPEDADQSLVPRTWWAAARARYDANPEYWDNLTADLPWRAGLDVGDGGDDHGFARWRGPVLYFVDEIATKGDREDVSRAAEYGWDFISNWANKSAAFLQCDRIGVGAGALSEMLGNWRKAGANLQGLSRIFGYNAGNTNRNPNNSAPVISPEFTNQITQDAWMLREAFRLNEIAIAPLPAALEERAKNEFAKTYYRDDLPGGKTGLEPKEATKKRLGGKSPDLRDAIIMGYAAPTPQLGKSASTVGATRSAYKAIDGY